MGESIIRIERQDLVSRTKFLNSKNKNTKKIKCPLRGMMNIANQQESYYHKVGLY